MRKYVSRLLSPRYEVIAVADGEAALATVRARQPDLVLADVMMPRLDGFGLLQKLRTNPKTKTIPIILLSARAGEESRVEGLQRGADDYLIKPFSARELVARVGTNSTNRLAQLSTTALSVFGSPAAPGLCEEVGVLGTMERRVRLSVFHDATHHSLATARIQYTVASPMPS